MEVIKPMGRIIVVVYGNGKIETIRLDRTFGGGGPRATIDRSEFIMLRNTVRDLFGDKVDKHTCLKVVSGLLREYVSPGMYIG